MKRWYHTTPTGQKVFLYALSLLVTGLGMLQNLTVMFIGLVPLLVLVYLQLGESRKTPSPD